MKFQNMFTGETVVSQPWQDALQPGDCYAIDNPGIGFLTEDSAQFDVIEGLTIFGEILDADGCDKGFFNVKAYSVGCPKGEFGMICIADVSRVIARREFELARENGWVADHCDECRSPSNDLTGIGIRKPDGSREAYICRECRWLSNRCEYCGTPKSAPNFAYHVCAPVRRKAGRR